MTNKPTLAPTSEKGAAITQADREAAAKALGYKSWEDATDYRLTGAEDQRVSAFVKAFAAHRISTPTPSGLEAATIVEMVREKWSEHEGDTRFEDWLHDERGFSASLRALQAPATHGDFRCHNCKRIVTADVAPEKCPDCWCSAFSAVAPSSPEPSDTVQRDEAPHCATAISIGHLDKVLCSCGWESRSYMDGAEYAEADWKKHVKESALKQSPSPAPRMPEDVAKQLYEALGDAICKVPEGWWWSVGACGLTAHASVGPDRAHISEPILTAFDGGFHADIPQPSTPAEALLEVCADAASAIATYETGRGL